MDTEIYIIEPATVEDEAFLGIALRESERAHTGIGLWDIALNQANCTDNEAKAIVLGKASIVDCHAHCHYSRFLVIREKESKEPVAAACGYGYPEFSVPLSMPGISRIVQETMFPEQTYDEVYKMWEPTNFLADSYPPYDYDNSWFIESVYTSPAHRGRQLAQYLIQALLEKGKALGFEKRLLVCAIGNEAALKMYVRCGYEKIGEGHHEDSMKRLGTPGFVLLRHY